MLRHNSFPIRVPGAAISSPMVICRDTSTSCTVFPPWLCFRCCLLTERRGRRRGSLAAQFPCRKPPSMIGGYLIPGEHPPQTSLSPRRFVVSDDISPTTSIHPTLPSTIDLSMGDASPVYQASSCSSRLTEPPQQAPSQTVA